LREILIGCNRRYLVHLSALDDFSTGVRALDRLTKPRKLEEKTVKGINFFEPGDSALLHALQNPRVTIAGIRRAGLLPDLEMFSPNRLSRQLRRLLDLGAIKRVTGTYRYYLTKAGTSIQKHVYDWSMWHLDRDCGRACRTRNGLDLIGQLRPPSAAMRQFAFARDTTCGIEKET
jgi:DNA-binding HxlR family transcriptional regulator